MGEPPITKSRECMANKGNGNEDEEWLVSLKLFSNASTGWSFENIKTLHEEERGRKVDRKSYSDITGNIGPTANPGCYPATPFRGESESLIVDPTSSRVDRCYLC